MKTPFILLVASAALLPLACGGTDTDTSSTATSSAATGTGSSGTGGGGMGGSGTGGSGMGGGGTGGSAGAGGMTSTLCGDGNVDYQLGEECDDANNASGDGCSAQCKLEAAASCGNGMLDLVNNEECDDGNSTAGDGCSPACQLETVGLSCGDGSIGNGEVCDDGNTINGDGCNPTCNLQGITALFAGSPGQQGRADGVGNAATFGGAGVITANATHLFIGDEANHSIRSVEISTATVQTIAGDATNGVGGYVDNPTGLNARFGSVEAITTDGSTIWIADGANHVIRAISTMLPFAVSTVAGSGTAGYTDGIGGAAAFDGIRGLTYYNGFVYLLDPTAATVRRFNPATGEVTTLAGTAYMTGQADGLGTAAQFMSPRYMASDGSGMLYIADTNGSKIRSYNTVTTEVRTFAGTGMCGYTDGPGATARVHRPRGMTSDGTSIYWVEFNAHTIRQGVVASADISTLVGTPAACTVNCSCPTNPGGYMEGTGSMAVFDSPFSVVFHYPSKSLFAVDGGNFIIRQIK
jgi:cysteine-rich repeat protein